MIMKKEKKHQVKCCISEFDRDCIERYSKASSKIVSAYVRETASNFCMLNYDWRVLDEHRKVLYSLRNAVNTLFLFVRRKDNYVSGDLALILKTMNEIADKEGDLLGLMLFDIGEKKKVIVKETKKIVSRHLERKERGSLKNG